MSVVVMERDVVGVSQEDQFLLDRLDVAGAELARNEEFQTLFNEYLQLQKTILLTDDQKQREKLLFQLEGITDRQFSLVERFFYLAGRHDGLKCSKIKW